MPFWSSKVKDPVCGMEIEKKKAPASAAQGRTDYFFCSPVCKADFLKSPDRYTGKSTPQQPAGPHAGGHH